MDEIKQRLEAEARRIHDEDVASCRAMGAHGATLVPDDARILTHCNAGALATAGYGTALGVIRAAVEQGKHVAVLADETRPFLQGARLTAWELVKDGIDTTVITDNMAGSMMRLGHVDLVVVGADRIAANGDVANKIGTYGVAVLAKEHGIPFYVAAPISTIDLEHAGRQPHPDRRAQRPRSDARRLLAADAGRRAHPQSRVRRDAGKFVTAIITERGIARPPYAESLAELVGSSRQPAVGRSRPVQGMTSRRARPPAAAAVGLP